MIRIAPANIALAPGLPSTAEAVEIRLVEYQLNSPTARLYFSFKTSVEEPTQISEGNLTVSTEGWGEDDNVLIQAALTQLGAVQVPDPA